MKFERDFLLRIEADQAGGGGWIMVTVAIHRRRSDACGWSDGWMAVLTMAVRVVAALPGLATIHREGDRLCERRSPSARQGGRAYAPPQQSSPCSPIQLAAW
jgi:hypothetical protein